VRLNLEKPREVIVAVGDAEITARILPSQTILDLRKRHTRFKSSLGESREEFDQKAYSEDFWDLVISKWSGLTDESDQPIPCTRNNKHAVVSKYTEIALKIDEEIESARIKTFEVNRDLEKNS
jgi:hypothetical protein